MKCAWLLLVSATAAAEPLTFDTIATAEHPGRLAARDQD
jgi:hypothetical protein